TSRQSQQESSSEDNSENSSDWSFHVPLLCMYSSMVGICREICGVDLRVTSWVYLTKRSGTKSNRLLVRETRWKKACRPATRYRLAVGATGCSVSSARRLLGSPHRHSACCRTPSDVPSRRIPRRARRLHRHDDSVHRSYEQEEDLAEYRWLAGHGRRSSER